MGWVAGWGGGGGGGGGAGAEGTLRKHIDSVWLCFYSGNKKKGGETDTIQSYGRERT